MSPLHPPRPLRRQRSRGLDVLLSAIEDHSPFLRGLIAQNRDLARDWLAQPTLQPAPIAEGQNEAEMMRILRHARQHNALTTALADLSGHYSVLEVTEALTHFADQAVQAALRFVLREAAKAGQLQHSTEEDCGLFILALGKHGGGELNYSSDIDLVVFYDPETRALPPNAAPAPLFVRLVQRLARLLEQRTADGYVLRVDLRLRPDPGATPIAMSFPAALEYYQTLGQNWERAALIKARPIAGDLALGETFLQALQPFIFRKYFDYSAIADIHAMKRQIHATRGYEEVAIAGHNIKLGRGGIREIEFFVQTQQLIFGGRRSNLRQSQTLNALQELGREGWVSQEAVEELTAAYLYLRAVEHRLQMQNDEQTQRLPSEPTALKDFARFCGYANLAGFAQDLERHLRIVAHHYAHLFEEEAQSDSQAGNLVFGGVDEDPDTLITLTKMGFQQPQRAVETVRAWHFGRRPALRSTRAREALTALTPSLLAAFSHSGDADAALDAFDAMLSRMPAVAELMSILQASAPLRELFGDLLGGAPRLAHVVAQRPHALDMVLDSSRTPSDLVDERGALMRAQACLKTARDFEDALNRARDYGAEEKFLIGIRLLSGTLDTERAGRAYSALAGGLVAALLTVAEEDLAATHGHIADARVVVLALGKLGSAEMTAASDLDLIVIYDAPDRPSDGEKPLPPPLYYTRLTQRLVAALTSPTRAGRLYDVDLRLRPSGHKGPLATSFSAFRAYQQHDAETWEHMALTRARVVAGDTQLGQQVTAFIQQILRRKRRVEDVARDVREMRALIAQEKKEDGLFDFKWGQGGFVEMDFLAQFLILAHVSTYPALTAGATSSSHIFSLASEAQLMSPDHAHSLTEAYRLLTSVTQILRLTLPDDFDLQTAAAGIKRRIATATNAPNFERLVVEIADMRARAHALFQTYLET